MRCNLSTSHNSSPYMMDGDSEVRTIHRKLYTFLRCDLLRCEFEATRIQISTYKCIAAAYRTFGSSIPHVTVIVVILLLLGLWYTVSRLPA